MGALPYVFAVALVFLIVIFVVHSIRSESAIRRLNSARPRMIDVDDACVGRLSSDYEEFWKHDKPEPECSPLIAAKDQANKYFFKYHPDPECQVIGEASTVVGSLSGEELKLFEKKLFKTVGDANASLITALQKEVRNRSDIYLAVSRYDHDVLSRGNTIESSIEQANLNRLINDLEQCSISLGKGSPGEARKIANKWYRYWRSDKKDGFKNGILPRASTHLAILVIRAIRSVYGDTFEWTKKGHHEEEVNEVKKL